MHRHTRRHLRSHLTPQHAHSPEATFQRRIRVPLFGGVALALVSALFAATDVRASGPAASAAMSATTLDPRYAKERAACDNGTSANQDRDACLKEAGAAKAEAKKGTLADGASPQTREVNAVMRCNALPQKDRADCMARIDGPAANQRVTASGSVAGDGVIRETVTTTTSKAASTPR